MTIEPAGPQWCARFPGSASIDDLEPGFRAKVAAFLDALRAAGASVVISATYRPPERAYLMHWCCQIAGYRDKAGAFHQQPPGAAAAMSGVQIDWTCGGDPGKAIAAAQAMKVAYNIAYPAVLKSCHTQRLAIDMTNHWSGTLQIRNAVGSMVPIASTPRDGTNPSLAVVGETYGVIKLPSDPPHWLSDGH